MDQEILHFVYNLYGDFFIAVLVMLPFPHMLFTDDAYFTHDRYFNSRNSHIWDYENPHAIAVRNHQQRFAVNMWAGIVGIHLLGPVILPARLTGAAYLQFLQTALPDLLDNVPLAVRSNLWFQHDGAPAHFSIDARAQLTVDFGLDEQDLLRGQRDHLT